MEKARVNISDLIRTTVVMEEGEEVEGMEGRDIVHVTSRGGDTTQVLTPSMLLDYTVIMTDKTFHDFVGWNQYPSYRGEGRGLQYVVPVCKGL